MGMETGTTEALNAAPLGALMGEFGQTLFNPLSGLAHCTPPSTRIVWELEENKQSSTGMHKNTQDGERKESSLDSCANLTIESHESTAATTPESMESLTVDLQPFEPTHRVESEIAVGPTPESTESPRVNLYIEPPHVLEECPRILSMEMIQQLHDEGLTGADQMCRWERCFAIGRDGDSFCTFVDRCLPYRRTFVVIQTIEGYILGGYAAMPWRKADQVNNSYFGTGQSFLFASHPAGVTAKDSTRPLCLFRWTGKNDFCQVSDSETSRVGMGGGADFGFLIQDHFLRGRTGPCGTFGNPCLVPFSDFFEIEAVEVYGLRPYGESMGASNTSPPLWAASLSSRGS